ncbi:MAG: hypothetical protein LQ343_005816 [Gyalolechia ehrenbergii]|nr:MAG: hypothetical protein LQ343_005816 [Gyalolechia ehrenbergii]
MTDRRKPKPHSNQLVDTLPASSSIGPPPEPTRSECRRSTRIHSHTDKTLVPGPSSMGPPPLPTQPRRSTRIASRPVNEHSDDNEAAISSQGSSSKRGGSGHKRRQSEMEASSEVPSSSSRATGFSASTKNKVELEAGALMVGIAPDIFPDAVRNALTSLNLLYRTHDNSQPLTAASSIFRRPGPGAYGPGDSNDDGGNVGNLRAPPPPHPTPKGRQAAKPGQAGSSRPSHKGKKRPVDQYADRRRSARIQDRFFRKHFGRSKEEQDRARRLLEDPPAEELILRREITDGIWKWGPMSSSNEAMMAPKKTSEQKTHIGTKKARLSQGLLSPSTGGRV